MINLHHLPVHGARGAWATAGAFGLRVSLLARAARSWAPAAGRARCARFFGDEPFLLVNGDVVFDFDLRGAACARHAHAGARATLALRAEPRSAPLLRRSSPDRDGRVRVAGRPAAAGARHGRRCSRASTCSTPRCSTACPPARPTPCATCTRRWSPKASRPRGARAGRVVRSRQPVAVPRLPARAAGHGLRRRRRRRRSSIPTARGASAARASRGRWSGRGCVIGAGAPRWRAACCGTASGSGRGRAVRDSILASGTRVGAGETMRGRGGRRAAASDGSTRWRSRHERGRAPRRTPRSARKRGGRRGPERPPPPPALPPGPTFPGDPSPDQRVESYLRERYGARVGDVTVTPLSGDASTRRYYRVLRRASARPSCP